MNGDAIRAASAADADAIARIHVETWRATYAGILPDAYLVQMDLARQLRMWRDTIRGGGRGHHVLVAERAGAVVGFASCGAARRAGLPRQARWDGPYDGPYDGEVYTLYVDPDHQGHGHGRRLLEACFGDLRDLDKSAALVWVLAANPARFFYEAMGGRKVAERSENFAGTALAEFAFGWDLTAAGPAANGID